jgi:hypothetical protein
MAKSTKDKEMAAFMKEHGPRAPSSWNGCGAEDRALAKKMGSEVFGRSSSTFDRGMLGGVLAYRCGMTSESPL